MEHHKLVLPEYLNDHGSLFGGYLLKWLDEYAYVTVKLEFPGRRFVTIALDDVEFRHPVRCGQVLRFVVTRERTGRTSVTYNVEVLIDGHEGATKGVAFTTRITFVSVDEAGNKTPLVRQ